jgi:peroxiredoxin
VTRRYGLIHGHGGHKGQDVARPTTVVIDRRGIVRWLQLADSIQIRPDATDVARAVRQLGP